MPLTPRLYRGRVRPYTPAGPPVHQDPYEVDPGANEFPPQTPRGAIPVSGNDPLAALESLLQTIRPHMDQTNENLRRTLEILMQQGKIGGDPNTPKKGPSK